MTNKIETANMMAAEYITECDPYWIDVCSAGECVEGLENYTILHAGPPIEYEQMCQLHKQGMVNAVLFEGWADNVEDAKKLIVSGNIKIDSAMNYNTNGSGTGIITKSVPMLVIEDRNSMQRTALFPAEGRFGGGFCGWGVYSKEISENLVYMREKLFEPIKHVLYKRNGMSLKNILNATMQRGDELHSRQTAADPLITKEVLPFAFEAYNTREIMEYFINTPRFFHNFGQACSRSAMLAASKVRDSSIVTAAGGNGVEFGIKVASLGDEWFTASSPMIKGKYMTNGAKSENQLPWIGDSSIVECAGLGGIISAASAEVCSWRDENFEQSISVTREMEKICVTKNKHRTIPALDFDSSPVGIDIRKVVMTGIKPIINGGMIDKNGGWIGAGCARIPMECFIKANKRLSELYGTK